MGWVNSAVNSSWSQSAGSIQLGQFSWVWVNSAGSIQLGQFSWVNSAGSIQRIGSAVPEFRKSSGTTKLFGLGQFSWVNSAGSIQLGRFSVLAQLSLRESQGQLSFLGCWGQFSWVNSAGSIQLGQFSWVNSAGSIQRIGSAVPEGVSGTTKLFGLGQFSWVNSAGSGSIQLGQFSVLAQLSLRESQG